MATIRVKEWVYKNVDETCAYHNQYKCHSLGEHLIGHVSTHKDREEIYVLVCGFHLNEYQENGWYFVNETIVNLVRNGENKCLNTK